jgi:hypothetical protein
MASREQVRDERGETYAIQEDEERTRACRGAFVERPRQGEELPALEIELTDGNSVRRDAVDVDPVRSRFIGGSVKLARAAQNGYTIDQYPVTRRTTIRRDTATRSSKRAGRPLQRVWAEREGS